MGTGTPSSPWGPGPHGVGALGHLSPPRLCWAGAVQPGTSWDHLGHRIYRHGKEKRTWERFSVTSTSPLLSRDLHSGVVSFFPSGNRLLSVII